MSSGTQNIWVPFLAAVGIGTIIAAVVGLLGSKAVAISHHRQNWIDALREDVVLYLKEIEVMHFRLSKLFGQLGEPATTEDLERQQETRNDALLVYRRILLRLNMMEPSHILLERKLKDLHMVQSKVLESNRVDAVIIAARQLLKHEWEVTKYGVLTSPIVGFKDVWRGLWRSKRTEMKSAKEKVKEVHQIVDRLKERGSRIGLHPPLFSIVIDLEHNTGLVLEAPPGPTDVLGMSPLSWEQSTKVVVMLFGQNTRFPIWEFAEFAP
jgi:hypothetical protein